VNPSSQGGVQNQWITYIVHKTTIKARLSLQNSTHRSIDKPQNISSNLNMAKTRPTGFQDFKQNPALFTAKLIYERSPSASLPWSLPPQPPITIVCVSDTHNKTPPVPDGDIFLHGGDLTSKGTFTELQAQLHWINTLSHRHKIVIAGNHDFLLDQKFVESFRERIFVEEGHSRTDLN
jgi:calcineurin-like phosphoesterase family protein